MLLCQAPRYSTPPSCLLGETETCASPQLSDHCGVCAELSRGSHPVHLLSESPPSFTAREALGDAHAYWTHATSSPWVSPCPARFPACDSVPEWVWTSLTFAFASLAPLRTPPPILSQPHGVPFTMVLGAKRHTRGAQGCMEYQGETQVRVRTRYLHLSAPDPQANRSQHQWLAHCLCQLHKHLASHCSGKAPRMSLYDGHMEIRNTW